MERRHLVRAPPSPTIWRRQPSAFVLTTVAERNAIWKHGRQQMTSKKYNVGIIGYGWVSSAHIAAINATPHARVSAICSTRKLDAAQVSGRHGGTIICYNDLPQMLADKNLHV